MNRWSSTEVDESTERALFARRAQALGPANVPSLDALLTRPTVKASVSCHRVSAVRARGRSSRPRSQRRAWQPPSPGSRGRSLA